MSNDPILGTFYASELQKVNKNEETIWRIDRILRKRKKRRQKRSLSPLARVALEIRQLDTRKRHKRDVI